MSALARPRTGQCTATRTGRPLSSWRGALATFRNSCATTRAQRRSARTDEDDIALFLVPSSAPGLRVRLHKHLDLTRRVCAVELADVSVDSEAMLAGGAALYRRLLGIGAVAIAADSLGGMERALEMPVEYSKCASNSASQSAPIRLYSTPRRKSWPISNPPARSYGTRLTHETRSPQMLRVVLRWLRHAFAEAHMRNTDKAVLMHGGIGFTWEHDIHLWFKTGAPTNHFLAHQRIIGNGWPR